MDLAVLAIVAALCCAVAFVFANLGLGGGIMYVPIMLMLVPGASTDAVTAVMAASLFFAMFTHIPSVYNHHRKGVVDLRAGLLVAAFAVVGAVFGAMFTMNVSDWLVKGIFASMLVVVGVKMLYDDSNPKNKDDEGRPVERTTARLAAVAVVSLGTGFLSGSMGIGGGIITVPLLVYALGLPTRKAIGTSSLAIPITALAGFATYYSSGADLNWQLLALTPLIFIGGYVGSRWGLEHLKTPTVRHILIGMIFLAAAKMFFDTLA